MHTPAMAPPDHPHAHPTFENLRDFVEGLHANISAATGRDEAGVFRTMAQHCREAADSLAASRPSTAPPAKPSAARNETPSRDRLAVEVRVGLQLATDVLNDTRVPLTPFEVLAITRTVTSLCVGLAALQEIPK